MSDSGSSESGEPALTQWFVYVVRCKDGTLYTGIATDVARRLSEHESATGRGAKYLRGKTPLRLLLTRAANSRETALRVEHRMKQLPRARKEELLRDPAQLDRIVEEEAARAAPA